MDAIAPVTSVQFRTACGRFATGVAIVTALDTTGGKWGMTVNSFSSVSLDPPLVLFSVDNAATSLRIFEAADSFAVNILSQDQQALSDRFSNVRDTDRFDGVALDAVAEGDPPALSGALCQITCDLQTRVPGGDHTILIGKVRRIHLDTDPTRRPLLYYGGGYSRIDI